MPLIADQIKYCESETQVSYYRPTPADWWKQTERIQYPRSRPHNAAASQSKLEKEFQALAEAWKTETRGYSITSQKYAHPAYQSILVLGEQVVPFILEDLRENGGRWFEALKALTKQTDIAKSSDSYEDAVKAWVAWGKQSKLIR